MNCIRTLSVLFAVSFFGCEEVPVVVPDKMIIDSGKTILIEDVTGVDCSNCPAAVERLEEISEDYPGNIILVGVHGIQQSAPIPEKSKYDFRNEDAAIIENYLRPWAGKPAASFNRIQFDGQENLSISSITAFSERAEEALSIPQTISIETSKQYNENNRILTINAGVSALEDLTGDFFATVMITESHIIDYQLDPAFGGYDPNYEHNHVLRDIITSPTGDQISTELLKGEVLSKTWTYQVPTSEEGLWVID